MSSPSAEDISSSPASTIRNVATPLRVPMVPEEDETRGRSRSNSQTHFQTSQQELGMGRPGLQVPEGGGQETVSVIRSYPLHSIGIKGGCVLASWLGERAIDTDVIETPMRQSSARLAPHFSRQGFALTFPASTISIAHALLTKYVTKTICADRRPRLAKRFVFVCCW